MNNLVSIITPMFNSEKYIVEAITSVINQSHQNWEMIIIDDCSTDNSKKIVEKYKKEDPRIKLIIQHDNTGVAVARNRGIREAKGKYLAFLDSDDIWPKMKLSKQIEFMEKKNCAFSFTSYEIMNDSGEMTGKVIKVPEKVNYQELLRGNIIGCLTVLIDLDKVSDVKMPNIRHEDYATWLSILNKNDLSAQGINTPLAYYRKANNSLSSNKFKTISWTWNIYKRHLQMGFVESFYRLFIFGINIFKKYWNARVTQTK
ncbi:glycosyltransferase family 2 protein [Peribacillus butanolivorans]|uniref:glycosyltransferase family 2 protein n=1 Tax=Peribacillus butanolivorans TaxID=421767 RepID=UPI00366CC973